MGSMVGVGWTPFLTVISLPDSLTSLEYLDLPLDDDEEGLALWAQTWRGVTHFPPNFRFPPRHHPAHIRGVDEM